MKKIEIELRRDLDYDGFLKIVGFVSESIIQFERKDDILGVELEENADSKSIEEEIVKLQKRYVSTDYTKNSCIFRQEQEREYKEFQIQEDEQLLHNFGDGLYGLNEQAIFLYQYFEKRFEKIALESGAIKKMYPVLLPVAAYAKTGYLTRSPQYAMFCCNVHENMESLKNLYSSLDKEELKEFIRRPEHALSPSACFHTYLEYQGRVLDKNSVVSFTQSVFRNEGRFNYKEMGRLRDYHVREIVFIGEQKFVEEQREIVLQKTIDILKELDLNGNVSLASDPFVMPNMQKFKTIQVIDKVKYEMHLNLSKTHEISVASFNLHGTAFTYPFHIGVKECEEAVTGCVGFGLERWVIAFLCQYGPDVEHWPEVVKEEYKNEISRRSSIYGCKKYFRGKRIKY